MKHISLKRVTNTLFLILSITLSVYFLWFNCDEMIAKIITTMCGVFFEIGMRYNLAYARTIFKKGCRLGWNGSHLILGALVLFLFYGGYIIYNVGTMGGFFIAATIKQDQVIMQKQAVEDQKMIQLQELNEDIRILTKALDVEVKTSFRKKSEELEMKINKKKAERQQLLDAMVLTKEEKVIEKNPSRSVAEALGISLGVMLAWIYGFFAAGINLILIITSEDLPEKNIAEIKENVIKTETLPSINDNRKDLITYVNAAIRDSGKLNGNQRIMELTGLPLDQCIKFRNWLTKLKIDGTPAISVRQGGGNVNIPKHKILKAIEGV